MWVTIDLFAQQGVADSLSTLVEGSFRLGGLIDGHVGMHPMLEDEKVAEFPSGIVRRGNDKTAMLLISMALLFLVGGIKHSFPRYYQVLYESILPGSRHSSLEKQTLHTDETASLLFRCLYYLALSTGIFFILQFYDKVPLRIGLVQFWIMVSGLVLVYFIARYIVGNWIAWTFDKTSILNEYRHLIRVVNESSGLFLIPIILLMLLFKDTGIMSILVWLSICYYIGLSILKFARSRSLFSKLLRTDIVHFLLYLCAFEILPLFVLFVFLARV